MSLLRNLTLSVQDEVLVSRKSAGRQTWIAVAALTALALLALGLFYLVRAK
jgi:hypothetical protein